jgi:hypothetical protein
MRRAMISAMALAMIAAPTSAQVVDQPDPDMITLTGDFLMPITINGLAMQLRIDPLIGGHMVLNSASSAQLNIKPSMIGGVHRVGPVAVFAYSNVVNLQYGAVQEKKRIFRLKERAVSTIGDGIAAPAALDFKKVRLILRPEKSGETLVQLPLSKNGHHIALNIDGQEVAAGFNLLLDETLASADTGLLLSNLQRGSFSDAPTKTEIRMGVERPVRMMTLGEPLKLDSLSLAKLLVRVSDFGDASSIPAGARVDDDEIVVTGKSKKKPRHRLYLGRDFLKDCSSITYDFPARVVRLSCFAAA